eukprot:scaffold6540_cov126-Isochrysis_galbana.AAC.2
MVYAPHEAGWTLLPPPPRVLVLCGSSRRPQPTAPSGVLNALAQRGDLPSVWPRCMYPPDFDIPTPAPQPPPM